MKNSIKSFGEALKDKYGNNVFVNIAINHGWHHKELAGYKIRYDLYIEDIYCKTSLTFKELKELVYGKLSEKID